MSVLLVVLGLGICDGCFCGVVFGFDVVFDFAG